MTPFPLPRRRPPTAPHVQREMDAADVFAPVLEPFTGRRSDRPPVDVVWSETLPVCTVFGCLPDSSDGCCVYCGEGTS